MFIFEKHRFLSQQSNYVERIHETALTYTVGICRGSVKKINIYKAVKNINWLLSSITKITLSLLLTDRQLTDGQRTITDISSEVAKLQGVYNTAVQNRDEAKKQLAKELSEQQITKWELEHQQTRSKDYEKQADKIQMEIAALKSHIPMISESLFLICLLCYQSIKYIIMWPNQQHFMFQFSLATGEGCRHCLPGWTFINSECYYFAFSDAVSRRSWQEARNFCKKQGGDLAVADSREKHVRLNTLSDRYLHFWTKPCF